MYLHPDDRSLTWDLLLVAPRRLRRRAIVEILSTHRNGTLVSTRPLTVQVVVADVVKPMASGRGMYDSTVTVTGAIHAQIVCWDGTTDDIDQLLDGRHLDAVIRLTDSNSEPLDHLPWIAKSHPDARDYPHAVMDDALIFRFRYQAVCPPLLRLIITDLMRDRGRSCIPTGAHARYPSDTTGLPLEHTVEPTIDALGELVVTGFRMMDREIEQLRLASDHAQRRADLLEKDLTTLRDQVAAITRGTPSPVLACPPATAAGPGPSPSPVTLSGSTTLPIRSPHAVAHWTCNRCETLLPVDTETCTVCGSPR